MEQAELKTYAALTPSDELALEANSSYAQILSLIDGRKTVVDFGCGPGNLARFLAMRGCSIVGVDINPDHARMAREYCEDVLVADLDSASLSDLFPAQRFDVAVFADILEHLRDPARLLAQVARILGPGGYVIASIPNIAHGAVRLALLDGDFDYQPLGLLDDTHVRFFTRKSMEAFLERAGFVIEHVARTTAPIFEPSGTLVPAIDPRVVPNEVLEKLRNDPDSETLQFIVRAVPAGTAHGAASRRRVAALERRAQELEQKLHEAETELAQKLDVPSKAHFESVLERLHATTLQLEEARESALSAAQAVAAAEQQRDEAHSCAEDHRRRADALTAELQQLEAALAISGSDRARFETLLDDAKEALAVERQRNERHDAEGLRLRTLLEQKTEEATALAAERVRLQALFEEAGDALKAAELLRDQALTDAAAYQQQVNVIKAEAQQLSAALESAEKERSRLEALLTNANESLAFERRRVELRDAEALHLRNVLQQQVEQARSLSSQRDALIVQYEERAEQMSTLNGRLQEAEQFKAALEAERAERIRLEVLFAKADEALKNADYVRGQALNDAAEYRHQAETVTLEVQQLGAALEMAAQQRSRLEALLSNVDEALSFERRRVEQRDKEATRLQDILCHQIEQVNALAAQRDALLREQEQLSAVMEENANLSKTSARLEAELSTLNQTVAQLRMQIEETADLRDTAESEAQIFRAQAREAALRSEQAEFYLEAMRQSKFWRVRNAWFKLKGAFGITTDIP